MRCDQIEVNTEVFSAQPCGPLPLAHISNFKTRFVTLVVVVNALPVSPLLVLVSFFGTETFGVTDVVDDDDEDVVERDADGKDCSDETDETEGADGGADSAVGAGGFVLVEVLLLVLFLSVCVPSEVVLNDFFIDMTSSV